MTLKANKIEEMNTIDTYQARRPVKEGEACLGTFIDNFGDFTETATHVKRFY